ncbi:hypothetical protein MM236_01135 [Belliella sp. DSM 107340]|uniref:Uncharacterized protein n=1 Tax=Belliella calami TaxID=2923436 RepID=A0ABS9UK72_9BACT|nr:hypothetical protein [Belliella calami]MCH7396565.1 hypothetical protein [Belliella calami]
MKIKIIKAGKYSGYFNDSIIEVSNENELEKIKINNQIELIDEIELPNIKQPKQSTGNTGRGKKASKDKP